MADLDLNENARIYLAGHHGMVGSAIERQLREQGFTHIIVRGREQLDLLDQRAVSRFFLAEKPDCVIMAAAKVGGIHANSAYPADFIYQNLIVECNVIESAFRSGVQRLLFLGSSCIYPRLSEQPIQEQALMHGALEPTNESYAIAKIAGIKLCEAYNRQHGTDFRSVMPTNLYGPNDSFHAENSHVIPAMIRKFHEAKGQGSASVEFWGSGNARREFLHVDDMAAACIHVLGLAKPLYDSHTEPMFSHINLGSGTDVTIRELAETLKQVTGYRGEICWDVSQPDGMPRKLLDVTKLRSLGWQHSIALEAGLKQTYRWYTDNEACLRK